MFILAFQVPVSTTFPNGVAECEVASVTIGQSEDSLVCVAPAHCAANANAADPMGRRCQYQPTSAKDLVVKSCPATQTSTLGASYDSNTRLGRLRCWADPDIPSATCTGEASTRNGHIKSMLDLMWPRRLNRRGHLSVFVK